MIHQQASDAAWHLIDAGLLRATAEARIGWSGRDVLDLGCGSGLMGLHLREVHSLVGVAFDPVMLDAARPFGLYAELHQHDARVDRQFGEFDLVLSAGVFQYLDADEYGQAFRFAHMNLRSGGYLAFEAPACSEALREVTFNTTSHSLSDSVVAARAEAAGLTLVEAKLIPAIGAHRFRLLRKAP
ncbi:MAG: class I SAM-dependent methyltransferase [Magnetospirillum sp.]|nr:class I SAM-dependent methyltransferase [Magnetospirillum sp.]